MDDKMMTQLLKSYGAPMSAQNANAARAFFASNPDVAEHRAMGMRGSAVDDNSDLLDAQLDKHIADTAIPDGRVEVGQPVKADVPAPSIRGATTQQPMAKPTATPVRLDKQGSQYGDGTGTLSPGLPQGTPQAAAGDSSDQPVGGLDIGKIIMAILGTTATGALGGTRPGPRSGMSMEDLVYNPSDEFPYQKQLPAPEQRMLPAPQPKLPGANVDTLPSGAPEIPKSGIYDATKPNARAAVDAENDDMTRQMMSDLEKQAAQRRAQSTVNAAKRAVGRK